MACSCGGCGFSCANSSCCSGSCVGTCTNSCSGCGSGCASSCSGCSGTCQGTCEGTCKTACNTTCSGSTQDTNISKLNEITFDKIIKASDMNTLKTALDYELKRRSQTVSSSTFNVGTTADDTVTSALKNDITKINITINESAVVGNIIDNAYPVAIKNGVVTKYNELIKLY